MEYTPRRKLTREFKLEAVRQTALSEKPKAQVARELGVRVRRENAKLKLEIEILKKAAIYFAREAK